MGFDDPQTDQLWLNLKITREVAEELLDKFYLDGACYALTESKIEHLNL